MNQKIVLTRRSLIAVILIFSASCFVSCEKYVYDPPKIDTTIPVLFQTEIVPIFSSNCISCHKGTQDPDLRSDNAYDALKDGGYLNTENPESSSLYSKIVSAGHAARTSDIEKQKILAWITQGALNN